MGKENPINDGLVDFVGKGTRLVFALRGGLHALLPACPGRVTRVFSRNSKKGEPMKPFKTALWIAKFIAALTLLLVVIPGGLFIVGGYGVNKYSEYREAKQAEQDAVKAKQDTQELAGKCTVWETKHPITAQAPDTLPADFDFSKGAAPVKGFIPIGDNPPIGCVGPLEDSYNKAFDPYAPYTIEEPVPLPTRKPNPAPKRYAWSTMNNNMTAEYCDQGIHVGSVEENERVEILETNTCGARVRTKDGRVGWLYPGSSITTVAPKILRVVPEDAKLRVVPEHPRNTEQ